MDVERPPRLLPRLVLWGVGAVVVFMVAGWIVGTVLSLLRTLLVAGIVVAVVWAVVAIQRDRRR